MSNCKVTFLQYVNLYDIKNSRTYCQIVLLFRRTQVIIFKWSFFPNSLSIICRATMCKRFESCVTVFYHSFVGDNRIAGGSEVSISDYPFAAALLTNRGIGAVFQQVCGGTVLTCNTFLSAASCVHTDGV